MKAHDIDEKEWPMLVRHAGERRLRWQLLQVGYPIPALLPFNTKVLVKRKSWNNRYGQWRWDRAPGKIYGPDPWSSMTSGGYVVKMDDGRFVPSTDVVVEHPEPGEPEQLPMVQERPEQQEGEALVEAPRRRLRFKQPEPRLASLELAANSGEDQEEDVEQRNEKMEQQRLLEMHKAIARLLGEECVLVDGMAVEQMSSIPTLAMLANQKFDLECQLRAIDGRQRQVQEEENYLVTKTVTTDQVYKEWTDWTEAMKSEFNSIVTEKKAVRQVNREALRKEAAESGKKYEELPSKVVFTRKAGGKRKVRACICGNYEEQIATETYAGGCDAAQIRCMMRHGALMGWSAFSTDIRCAFLNAKRKDESKVIAMTIPAIYVRLGLATAQDVWAVDGAMYGLTTSPRDWSDHRDLVVPTIKWRRQIKAKQPGGKPGVMGEGDGRTCQFDRCYWKSPDPGSLGEANQTWEGQFVRAADQHLWHLRETCLETGQSVNRGMMAIYVDDVLMTAEREVGISALEAIASTWECAPYDEASLEKAITFCGFEVQANAADDGGGFRLHQASYEEDLISKWGIDREAWQIHLKLPTPEEEAEMVKSEDTNLVRQAQASTGALLWLSTRTRPELSVGVATMSRLCTKDPAKTLEIGKRLMEYLRRPTKGLVYRADIGPENGIRNQLSSPRCIRTVEAFSDISYASTKGYRSLQGQVYYYAGAPVMWNTNRQPFPTQSTAESELVAMCEALVGGRATAALVAAIRDEKEEGLKKKLWGDNSAAISLATGEGQGSWRTRHLRIRAAILRSALQQGEWQLGHLSGKELVADSFTKAVDGMAFEKTLQDLGIKSDRMDSSTTSGNVVGTKAKLALLVGSSILSRASAMDGSENEEDLTWLWTCGVILMSVGAFYLCSKAFRSCVWLCQRVQGTSGCLDGSKESGLDSLRDEPRVKMLRASDEEGWEVCSGGSEDPNEQSRQEIDGIRAMFRQQEAARRDPYNKMHGRDPTPWADDDDEPDVNRMLARATGDSLPRRRKKKGSKVKDREPTEDDESALRGLMQNLLAPVRNLHSRGQAASSSMRRPSGSHEAGQSSMTSSSMPRSGSEQHDRRLRPWNLCDSRAQLTLRKVHHHTDLCDSRAQQLLTRRALHP